MSYPFEFLDRGVSRFRKEPLLGHQDLGISPEGPMDRFSTLTANILLGQGDYCETLEILLPPKLKCLRSFYFVLTGAHRTCEIKKGSRTVSVKQGDVAFAPRGAELWFSQASKGFRTIFAFREKQSFERDDYPEKRKRGNVSDHFSFLPPVGSIRVLPGPEVEMLKNPQSFFTYPWQISPDSNEMGYRLKGIKQNLISESSMISDAVSDGTVQLTPDGPIALLYHRQTVGGYPRIFNIPSFDVDFLSQYAPGQYVRFLPISYEEAQEINSTKRKEIVLFRSIFTKLH